MLVALREIWRYRELLRLLVAKEIKLRYRRSFLGFAWTMLNPLVTMMILTVVFSQVLRVQVERFPVFILTALLPWNFFAQSVSGGALSLVHNESLLKKVYVPRAIFPIALVLSHLANFLFALVPLLLVMLWEGSALSPAVLFAPIQIALLALFTIGVTLALSAWTVFFRDLSHIVEVAMPALFYMTPIIYPLTVLPQSYRPLIELNPLLYLVIPLRTIFFEGRMPDARVLAVAALLAVISFAAGLAAFRRQERLFLHYLA